MIRHPNPEELIWDRKIGLLEDQLMGAYRIKGGPKFISKAPYDQIHMASHFVWAEDIARAVYLDICDQIDAHNAVTQPVPNGPEDEVWHAECIAMTNEALKAGEPYAELARLLERERLAHEAINYPPHRIFKCRLGPALDGNGYACTCSMVNIVGRGKTAALAAADFDRQYRS